MVLNFDDKLKIQNWPRSRAEFDPAILGTKDLSVLQNCSFPRWIVVRCRCQGSGCDWTLNCVLAIAKVLAFRSALICVSLPYCVCSLARVWTLPHALG